jgi:hypothetical protein
MRLRLLALGSIFLLAGCASSEYSTVPQPTGEWVAVNPPGFQSLPPAPTVRRVVHRVRVYRRPAAPVHTAQTTQPAAPGEAHP